MTQSTRWAALPREDVRLLTDDTNLMLTAQDCSLRFTPIPTDWLLAPEPDGRDKMLVDIRRRLDALEREFPAVTVKVVDVNEGPHCADIGRLRPRNGRNIPEIPQVLTEDSRD